MSTLQKKVIGLTNVLKHTNNHALPSETYVPQILPPVFSSFDLLACYIIDLFFLVNALIGSFGGFISLVYVAVGFAAFLVPCVLATAQLGTLYPFQGSLYHWTYRALGRFWSFFICICFWLRGVLVIVITAHALMSIVRALNPHWLVQIWQQGLTMLTVIALVGALTIMRIRVIQNLINFFVILTLIVVGLFLAAIVLWIVKTHLSLPEFLKMTFWGPMNPKNYSLFSLLVLGYTGSCSPLNTAGEYRGDARQLSHSMVQYLFWGTIIIFFCYLVTMTSLLTVLGFSLFKLPNIILAPFVVINKAFGSLPAYFSAVCIIGAYLMRALYAAYSTGRILMVAAIDGYLPVQFGLLSKSRSPLFANLTVLLSASVLTGIIFFLVPLLGVLGMNSQSLVTQFYLVTSATLGLIWAIATTFLFISIAVLYVRQRTFLYEHLIVPMPLLGFSICIGFLACLVAIIDLLSYSWTSLISNANWWYIISGCSLLCLIIAACGSLIAHGEARFQQNW